MPSDPSRQISLSNPAWSIRTSLCASAMSICGGDRSMSVMRSCAWRQADLLPFPMGPCASASTSGPSHTAFARAMASVCKSPAARTPVLRAILGAEKRWPPLRNCLWLIKRSITTQNTHRALCSRFSQLGRWDRQCPYKSLPCQHPAGHARSTSLSGHARPVQASRPAHESCDSATHAPFLRILRAPYSRRRPSGRHP